MNNEDFDKWDEYGEQVEEDLVKEAGLGGGGGKKKRDPKGKTSKQARQASIENSKEIRKNQARARIVRVLEGFPKFKDELTENSYLETYALWLNASLQKEEVVLDKDEDLDFQYSRSGGAGGQNVNKVSSAVTCKHWVTNMVVRNEQTRDQPVNKQNAVKIMREKLQKHIDDWKDYVSGKKEINLETVKDFIDRH